MSESKQVRPGDVVLVSNHRLAVVRYIGPVNFAQGNWIGVELKGHRDEKYGCDGSFGDKRYFQTKHEKAGLFVRNVIRSISAEELLQKVAELNEKLLLCTCGVADTQQQNGTNMGGDMDPNSSDDDN
eukprot:CAMPEP_0202712982 /NCGR_PEP_ID=MMETSP1385-20130828/47821_1 /ASSEMBLY_ACC=CAM_ASM_000861 /TAXON_ID=933848 /ORGANISM="Elphidium margaritaceum" /LENGTH=126 /DNA_ID=CAMNT_0049373187 /DNA_START=30 /DNA_END=410 /DNA_ORIENTATION=+